MKKGNYIHAADHFQYDTVYIRKQRSIWYQYTWGTGYLDCNASGNRVDATCCSALFQNRKIK